MKKISYIFITLLLLSFTTFSYAQKQTPPEGGKPKDFKLPEKETGKLQNGMEYVMVEYGAIPKVQISLIIKTGNVHEGEQQIWLSDLVGDLMKEGTTTLSGKEISLKSARMGGQLNINVSSNFTTISGDVLSEYAPDLIALIADVVKNPAFPAKEVDRLKADMKRNLSIALSRPQAVASQDFFATLYPNHPYGRIYPTEAMIDSYTVENVRDFYNKNFGAQRSVLYVVGKFNKAKVTEAIKKNFTDWQKGPAPSYPAANPNTSKEVSITDRKGAPQSTIMLGLPVVDPSHPDYLPLTVTNALLGGSFSSRITSNIREDKGYTYSPFSTVNTGKGVAVWYEQADVTTEHTGASLKEISYEIHRLQKQAPMKEELEGIQNYQAGIFVLQNSTPSGIINQLNFLDLHDLPDNYLTEQVKKIYAVTPEKVQEIAKKYLDYENMTLVVVGDKKKIDEQIEKYQQEVKTF